MAVFETWLESDLKKPVQVRPLRGNLFSADNGGNLIGVIVTDDGAAVQLSGSVTGYVIRDDGKTVVISSGTISGNRASIVLPASCYAVIGPISIVLKLGNTTLGACSGYVYQSTTDAIVDPGREIPSIAELLAEIENVRNVAAAANAAAASANSAASNANEKASAANTAAENANKKASAANTAAVSANEKAGLANTAAENANEKASAADAAAKKIDEMTVDAESLAPGSAPTATISEVDGHKHIHFGITKGDKGNKGNTGATPNLQIGTVETLSEESSATASIEGTPENPILNLGIPRGRTGSVENVYASNIPMTSTDPTTVKEKMDTVITYAMTVGEIESMGS